MVVHTFSRRRLLGAAGAAGALGLAGVAGLAAVAAAPPASSVAPVPVRLRTRWRRLPDGPMPARGDEGVPFRVVAQTGPLPTVSSGALVAHLPPRHAASYLMQDLQTKPQLIGAEFGFGRGSDSGSVGLIAWSPQHGLTSHCHLAITPTEWVAATAQDGELDEFARGSLSAPLVQDGRPYRAQVAMAGDTLAITLPDGSTVTASSEAVGRLPGTTACWEFYRHVDDSADVRFFENWAG